MSMDACLFSFILVPTSGQRQKGGDFSCFLLAFSIKIKCVQPNKSLKTNKGSSTSLTRIISRKLKFKPIFVSFLTVTQPELTDSLLSDADGARGLPRPGSGCNLQADFSG